ncbi:MAG: SGNH/GDSL hydrolase family protein [Candidatus Cloacimonetes bacterium]|nr:SGNH/GDSL hydrolase family protein [Candidatus Cloacimonadota bacterium]
MFQKFLRVLCVLLIFVVTLEVALQLLSHKVSKYRSYSEFYDEILQKAENSDPQKTIFFVGDSTVYGGGSTDVTKYSMPAQFEKLIKKKTPNIDILNIGYPGTTGKHHLDVLRRLPENSWVVIRTGINDSWNRFDYYKFYLFGKYYEFRTLKLLVILANGWRKSEESKSVSKDYYEALNKVASEKRLNLYYVDYFLGIATFMNETFINQKNFINLPKILKDSGFFTKKGFIKRKYLSFDLFHANDLGYRLQAIAIYNYFCKLGSMGLSKNDQYPLKLNAADHKSIKDAVNVLRKKIQSSEDFGDEVYPDLLNATWQFYLVNKDPEIKKDYLALQKIYLNAFHGAYAAINLLNSHQTGTTSTHISETILSEQELNFYYQMVQLYSSKEHADSWKKIYSEWFPKSLELDKTYSDYSSLPKPMPIEFCPKLLQETGWSKDKVSLQDAWKRIYNENIISSKRIIRSSPICQISH